MSLYFANVVFNAAAVAIQVGMYLAWGFWWSVAGAVFNGLLFIWLMVEGDR